MRRFWFEFEFSANDEIPPGLKMECGVTAYDHADALSLLKTKVFGKEDLPPIKIAIEDVDVSTLDEGHVLPNMNEPATRGIWFPLGYRW